MCPIIREPKSSAYVVYVVYVRTKITEVWQIMQIILKKLISLWTSAAYRLILLTELKAFLVEKQKTRDSLTYSEPDDLCFVEDNRQIDTENGGERSHISKQLLFIRNVFWDRLLNHASKILYFHWMLIELITVLALNRAYAVLFLFFQSATARQWAWASSLSKLHYLTHTLCRTPLGEGSARRTDFYLTKHNAHKRQTPIPLAGFEPTSPRSEQPQTHALDRAATGTLCRLLRLQNWHHAFESSYRNSICQHCLCVCVILHR